MTKEEIKDTLIRLREIAGDDETAHSTEDQLYRDFIEYVSTLPDLPEDLAEKARMILQSETIDFARWCA